MVNLVTNSITVFFPCYNEEENLPATISTAVTVLEDLDVDFEIVIIDDGSRDNTAAMADTFARHDSRIRVIHHPMNLGYGAALRSGFEAASKDLVFYTDGDGQFDIHAMPALLPLMADCDIVSCYRIHRADSLMRKLNAWCWTRLVGVIFGMHVRDVDCAFKLYRRRIFNEIRLSSTGALIDTEVLVRAMRKGYRVIQRGVHHYPRTSGVQTGGNVLVILRAFGELFRLRKEMRDHL